jgi:hypothetical protein
MNTILINISQTIPVTPSIIDATTRAWILNSSKASRYDYVVSVYKGEVRGHFRLQGVIIDLTEPDRVAFRLTNCTLDERRSIDRELPNENLRRFVTKYIS